MPAKETLMQLTRENTNFFQFGSISCRVFLEQTEKIAVLDSFAYQNKSQQSFFD